MTFLMIGLSFGNIKIKAWHILAFALQYVDILFVVFSAVLLVKFQLSLDASAEVLKLFVFPSPKFTKRGTLDLKEVQLPDLLRRSSLCNYCLCNFSLRILFLFTISKAQFLRFLTLDPGTEDRQ